MAAYSLYQANNYTEAVNALDRFIQLNPSNPNVDYAYYLKGLCYYEQIVDVGRDQQLTRDALDSFEEVTRRFPTSKYRSEEHTSELQSLMRISYAVFCLKKKSES